MNFKPDKLVVGDRLRWDSHDGENRWGTYVVVETNHAQHTIKLEITGSRHGDDRVGEVFSYNLDQMVARPERWTLTEQGVSQETHSVTPKLVLTHLPRKAT